MQSSETTSASADLLIPEVYGLAVTQHRVLITYNVKHFKPLAGSLADCGIIGLPPNVPRSKLHQLDTKLVALLTRTAPLALRGRYVSLTEPDDQQGN